MKTEELPYDHGVSAVNNQRIAPYTPHSNGMAERMVGVLLGSPGSSISDCGTTGGARCGSNMRRAERFPG